MQNVKRVIEDRETCLDCKFAIHRVYSTQDGTYGTEHLCTLQNNKLIYDEPGQFHYDDDYSDVPDCMLGLFEQD